MPKPNQTPCDGLCWALSFRTALAPTARLNAVSLFSPMMEPRQATDKIALHSRHYRANSLLACIHLQKIRLHGRMELTEVRSANCVSYGDQHVQAGLHQHAFIDSHVDLAHTFVLVDQNPRRERRNAVQTVWQQSERAI